MMPKNLNPQSLGDDLCLIQACMILNFIQKEMKIRWSIASMYISLYSFRDKRPIGQRQVYVKQRGDFTAGNQIANLFLNHHIHYFGRFPVSQFNDGLGGGDLKSTQWVQFRSTQPTLYFPTIMEFSHYNEYGVLKIWVCLHHQPVV